MGKFKLRKAFEYKDVTFYGGAAVDVFIDLPWDLVISLNRTSTVFPSQYTLDRIPEYLGSLKSVMSNPAPILRLDWPDMSTPDISKPMWDAIISDIKKNFSNKKAEIAVCCMAGHGRTGTALAILRTLLTGAVDDPVKAIRTSYYDEAVETNSQVEYVSLITGIESKCEGSKPYGYYGYNYYNAGNSNYGAWHLDDYTSGVSNEKADGYYYSDHYWKKDSGKELYTSQGRIKKYRVCKCTHDELDHYEDINKNTQERVLFHCMVCKCYQFTLPKKLSAFNPEKKSDDGATWNSVCVCLHDEDAHGYFSIGGKLQRYCLTCTCESFELKMRIKKIDQSYWDDKGLRKLKDVPYSQQSKKKTGWPRHKAEDCVSIKCPYHGEWN